MSSDNRKTGIHVAWTTITYRSVALLIVVVAAIFFIAMRAAFPQFTDFLKLKRKYDPGELFQSDWYRHYKKMFFG